MIHVPCLPSLSVIIQRFVSLNIQFYGVEENCWYHEKVVFDVVMKTVCSYDQV